MTIVSTAYISHGGGPLPLLGDERHIEMTSTLKTLANDIGKPELIVVVSAHWEESNIMITSNPAPDLYYDYYGFPDEAYTLKYNAPGHSGFASYLQSGLEAQGVDAVLDDKRGFDHGMFIPLSIMYPEAYIPTVQISLKHSLNPQEHIVLGNKLTALLADSEFEHILVLGSGSSFHNMKAFFQNTPETYRKAKMFDDWLQVVLGDSTIEESKRGSQLKNWSSAPQARFAHPREEHLLPLHVCYGINSTAADKSYTLTLLDKPASMFLWQR